ncbi:MAG TPA: hypothetical protein PLA74_01010 [Syntrophales bacterium]|nr:hypothetical protein [Syntrophales bacterium]HPQ43214.1 hypothetical protein [Syntrophales bacterium]
MNRFDDLILRCPRLGGEVTFAYCRREQGTLPCQRTLGCWQNLIPVEEYLREYLTDDEWNRCFNAPPKDKMTTILEIADTVKKRKGM